jgi:hypothetical protein
MMMRAPQKPTKTANIRRHPMDSPSSRADRRVRMKGSTKKIEMASARGSLPREVKNSRVASAIRKPRAAWTQSLRPTPRPPARSTKGSRIRVWKKNRLQVTWPEDMEPESPFAIASMPGSINIPITISRIPSCRLRRDEIPTAFGAGAVFDVMPRQWQAPKSPATEFGGSPCPG